MALEIEIENLRLKLTNSVSKYGINSNKTIYISHELDKLINKYNKTYALRSKN